MNTNRHHRIHNSHALPKLLSMAIASALAGQALAAPGTLAKSPLFLSTSVQSNIFLTVDDSGSMDWEVLKSAGAETHYTGSSFPNSGNVDITPSRNDRDEILESCAGYNTLYYDPTETYTPWAGVDINGVTYPDQSITAARNNPYDPAAGTTNLTLADGAGDYPGYMVWADDGDGVFQQGECPDPGSPSYDYANQFTPTTDMTASQKTNFANWFSYYRKREYVAKRALSEIIAKSTSRMGLATLWNNNSVRTPIRDIDDVTTPVNATARANKNTLLRNLYRINSSGGTPLRRALQNTGIYFESGMSSWGTAWANSPILPESQGGSCQQNFTIIMSDGYWNTDSAAEILANNADGNNDSAWDGGSYADTYSDTLADVAMYYYERDLSPLPNEVRRTASDQNNAQHLVTFTVAFGVDGTLSANPTDPAAPFAWPEATANDPTAIDDMRHAAWNGRGQFLSASNPDQLITSLGNAIADIDARSGSAAAVSFNSTSLQSDTMIFQAVFDSARWSGDLNAIPLSTTGTVGSTAWTAANGAALDAKGLDERNHSLRTIYTFDGTSGIDLSWSNLTTAQRNDLKTNPDGTLADDATGMARLGFIRGDRNCEQSSAVSAVCSYSDGTNTYSSKTFRDRSSRLGDIVHSSPLFVGGPNTPYPDSIESVPYSNYVNSSAKNRREVVYVGSNDGMLHAFDTENSGQELFAYVPNLLFTTTSGTGLHYLTDPTFTHNWYVDLSATSADVYINNWKTLLVGGLRGGGKGVFALDVTDPSTFGTSDVLWEFTHSDLGYTFSDIRIGKLNNGKWAAIFGNGYNNDPSGDGRAKLFILYLDGSNLSNPMIISTGTGSMTNNNCGDPASDCNGLSSPALADLNGDGTIDRVYAGDLHGNLWSFDIGSTATASWGLAHTGTPLARACTSVTCTTGNRQPITSRPSLARHKTQRGANTSPNIMVFFGTGQYISANDNDNTLQQTFYGIWDSGSGGVTRSDLLAQTLTTDTSNGQVVRKLSNNTVDYSTQRGWYIDLPITKERIVTSSVAFGDLVFFNSMIPSTNICGYGGSGWLMLATQLNGGAPQFGAVDVNGDGVIDNADLTALGDFVTGIQSDGIPTESRFISDKRVTTDSSGAIKVDNVEAFEHSVPARTSWSPLEF